MTETLFGLETRLVRELIAGVTPGGDVQVSFAVDDVEDLGSSPEVAERFARAAWSCVAEPGDSEAGGLLSSIGGSAALTALIERWPAERAGRSAKAWARGLERWTPRLTSTDVVRALRTAARTGTRLLIPTDEHWPQGLIALGDHSPSALWLRGDPTSLRSLDKSIAIVGARASTGYGDHVAMESSAGLVDRGFSIVSGAAYGIDGVAHRAAIGSGGTTIAFLAGGADRFYPSGHHNLLERVAASGAVVSELPCGSAPTRWRFLQRNRLIAAASSAVVVIEAGLRSGSLNTAGHAAALGRPVGAVPGPVTSPASAGCHRLLREYDAVCVSNAEQIAELTGWLGSDEGRAGPSARESPEETRVTDALSSRRPRTADEVAKRSGLSRSETLSALGSLGAVGRVEENAEGWILRRTSTDNE